MAHRSNFYVNDARSVMAGAGGNGGGLGTARKGKRNDRFDRANNNFETRSVMNIRPPPSLKPK